MFSPVVKSACVKYCPQMNVHLPANIQKHQSGESTMNSYRPLLDPLSIKDKKQPLQNIRPLQSIQLLQNIRPLQSIQPLKSIKPRICLEIPQPLQQRKTKNIVLYKTRQCKNFLRTGSCRYNKNCQFAHGSDDVVVSNRLKNYKTRPCNNFSSSGVCYFGKECSFLHIGDFSTHPFDFIPDFFVMPRPLHRLDVFNKIVIKSYYKF